MGFLYKALSRIMVCKLIRRATIWLKTGLGGILGREPRDEKIRDLIFVRDTRLKTSSGLTESLSAEQIPRRER